MYWMVFTLSKLNLTYNTVNYISNILFLIIIFNFIVFSAFYFKPTITQQMFSCTISPQIESNKNPIPLGPKRNPVANSININNPANIRIYKITKGIVRIAVKT